VCVRLQKFKFCGDLDCPDWVLAEMNILSKIVRSTMWLSCAFGHADGRGAWGGQTSVRMKLLVVQVLNELLGGTVDVRLPTPAHVAPFPTLTPCRGVCVGQYAKVAKLVANANWTDSDIKASIAAISFILGNSAKYNVDGDTLATELQQLGLPKGWSPHTCTHTHKQPRST
jgi:COMM domain containing 4